MKFIANHTLVIGKGASAKTLVAGDTLPNLSLDELLRLRDLEAIRGVGEGDDDDLLQQAATRKAAAEKSAADRSAATKTAAETPAADKEGTDKAGAEKAAAGGAGGPTDAGAGDAA